LEREESDRIAHFLELFREKHLNTVVIIRERMADLGGAAEISSEPGQGTRVTLRVPVDQGKQMERNSV